MDSALGVLLDGKAVKEKAKVFSRRAALPRTGLNRVFSSRQQGARGRAPSVEVFGFVSLLCTLLNYTYFHLLHLN